MCGIAGILKPGPQKIEEPIISAMSRTLRRRGPDDQGVFLAPGVALVSTRLAILDLSPSGHMPMQTPDGRFTIVHNGEIYNYRDFYPYLKSKGWKFKSHSDTEVLLYLFAQDGPAMLDRLNGMFAFAVWDAKEKKLFAARDRMGVKPFYYSVQGRDLYFASEEKTLFAAGVKREFNEDVLEELLLFRYVAGERTPFACIKRLLPGTYLTWSNGEINQTRWWNLSDRVKILRSDPPPNPRAWFKDTFDDAVRLRFISDVPVGVLLSGGLDSGSIAASLAFQNLGRVNSFTVRFQDPKYDEGVLSGNMAKRWGFDHHEITVRDEEIMPLLRRAVQLNDEPLAHGNDLHLLAVSEYAKSWVTVLLSGEGGDETLGGYVRYQPLRFMKWLNLIKPFLSIFRFNGRYKKLKKFLDLNSADAFVLYNACNILPEDLEKLGINGKADFSYRRQILEEARLLYPQEPFRQAMYLDHHTFLCSLLDRNDRMTMGASIECRTPFLDYRLVEQLAATPTTFLAEKGHGKKLLRIALGDRLPEAVLKAPKWGFGVPWSRHLKDNPEFLDFVQGLKHNSFLKNFFTLPTLEQDFKNEAFLLPLINLAIWHQEKIQRSNDF